MQGILSGEKDESGTPRVRLDFTNLGSMSAITEQGVGYRPRNEDAVAWVTTPAGEIILMDFDGMGGYAHGHEAANLAAEKMIEYLADGRPFEFAARNADRLVRQAYPDAGAAFAAVRIIPSSQTEESHRALVHWAGDVRAFILRRNPMGQWFWVYRTSDDSLAKELVDGQIDGNSNEAGARTLNVAIHPMGNVVTNGLGKTIYQLNTTPRGELPSREVPRGYRKADGLESIELYSGDVVLLFSDGVGDNYLRTRDLMSLLETAENETEIVDLVYHESLYKMRVLKEAKASQACADGGRYAVTYEGKSPDLMGRHLWVDRSGMVWDALTGGHIAARLKADNISVMALQIRTGPVDASNSSPDHSETTESHSALAKLLSWFRPNRK